MKSISSRTRPPKTISPREISGEAFCTTNKPLVQTVRGDVESYIWTPVLKEMLHNESIPAELSHLAPNGRDNRTFVQKIKTCLLKPNTDAVFYRKRQNCNGATDQYETFRNGQIDT